MNTTPDNVLLDELSERLGEQDDIVVAIAFGSAARGSLRPDSDLDVAILAQQPLSAGRRRKLIALLADVSGRPIDLVDLRTSGIAVTRAALIDGKRLVCRDRSALASLTSRMLLDSADFLPYRERILKARRTSWIG
jgi:predicted nucleotidyltransferase